MRNRMLWSLAAMVLLAGCEGSLPGTGTFPGVKISVIDVNRNVYIEDSQGITVSSGLALADSASVSQGSVDVASEDRIDQTKTRTETETVSGGQ